MNDIFLQSKLGKEILPDEVTALFQNAKGWEGRQRAVFHLSRQLTKLPERYRTDEFKIDGCESQVWLTFQIIGGKIYFLADSDSRIVKGLLGILLAAVNGVPLQQFSDFELNVYLSQLGLENYLSESRNSGLKIIENEIITIFEGLRLK